LSSGCATVIPTSTSMARRDDSPPLSNACRAHETQGHKKSQFSPANNCPDFVKSSRWHPPDLLFPVSLISALELSCASGNDLPSSACRGTPAPRLTATSAALDLSDRLTSTPAVRCAPIVLTNPSIGIAPKNGCCSACGLDADRRLKASNPLSVKRPMVFAIFSERGTKANLLVRRGRSNSMKFGLSECGLVGRKRELALLAAKRSAVRYILERNQPNALGLRFRGQPEACS
jgi:hypothetical protein